MNTNFRPIRGLEIGDRQKEPQTDISKYWSRALSESAGQKKLSKKNLSEEKKVSRKKFCEKKTLAKKKILAKKKFWRKIIFRQKRFFVE